MYLAYNKIIPPKEWCHDPNIRDNNHHTVAYYLKTHNIPVPNEWYDYSMKNIPKNPEFVQQAIYGIIPDKPKDIDPEYDCGFGWTIAMILAQNKIIPTQEWNHNKYLRNQNKDTVKTLLKKNNMDIPEYWNYEDELYDYYEKYNIDYKTIITPEYNNNCENMTYAMFLASKGIISSKQWQHQPNLQNKDGNTVAILLANNKIIPPQQWIHDKYIKDNKGKTIQHYLEENDIQVPKEWSLYIEGHENEPNYQNENGQTSAMVLAQKGIIPSKKMQHDVQLRVKDGNTVCYYLWDNGVMVPERWQDKQYKNPERDKDGFTKAMNQIYDEKKIPNKEYYHDPNIVNNNGWTVVMDLAHNGIIPPKQWYHNPEITDNDDWTVAMKLSFNKIIPPQEWEHDPILIEQTNNMTVAMHLADKGIIPPESWNHNPELQNKNKYTVALLLANEGIIPPKQWNHQPDLQNKYGDTVARLLAINKIIPPPQWNHNPLIKGYKGFTVAMSLAYNGIIPPKQWYHSPEIVTIDNCTVAIFLGYNKIIPPECWNHKPELQDKDGNTVAIFLAYYGIIPPSQWHHDPNIKDKDGKTVEYYLKQKGKTVPSEWKTH